jgi:hypothetical protein
LGWDGNGGERQARDGAAVLLRVHGDNRNAVTGANARSFAAVLLTQAGEQLHALTIELEGDDAMT